MVALALFALAKLEGMATRERRSQMGECLCHAVMAHVIIPYSSESHGKFEAHQNATARLLHSQANTNMPSNFIGGENIWLLCIVGLAAHVGDCVLHHSFHRVLICSPLTCFRCSAVSGFRGFARLLLLELCASLVTVVVWRRRLR